MAHVWISRSPWIGRIAMGGVLAGALVALAGGPGKLADRADALSSAGEHALACHLAELAGQAAPHDEGVWKIRRRVYAARAEASQSLMARGVYRTASAESPKAR